MEKRCGDNRTLIAPEHRLSTRDKETKGLEYKRRDEVESARLIASYDQDGDGVISVADSVIDTSKVTPYRGIRLDIRDFVIYDLDGDETLSLQELSRYFAALRKAQATSSDD